MLVALRLLMATALLGLLLSTLVHALAVLGLTPFGRATLLLHAGLFVVWVPVALVTWKIRYTDGDWLHWEWTALFRGSPIWLNALGVLLFAYVFFNSSASPPLRLGSAVWMCLYCIALSVLYSAYRQPWLLVGLLCPNGHKVSHVNRFCPECGACLPKGPASA